MELLQLKYFYESAVNESFAKTAERYMVPTTSVSASVKRLEKELGCTLFDRYSNKIKLNESGKNFLKSISVVISELEKAVVDISDVSKDKREIKMLVRAMRDDITEYIIQFRKEYPDIAFKITLDFNETDFKKYDIIIDEKSGRHPDYESFELTSMKLRLMTGTDNPLCKKTLTMDELKNESFVSWGEESNMHKILINACSGAGFTPDIAVMTNDMKCHEKLIVHKIGIGLAREGTKRKGMQALNVTDFNETYTVCTYYKKNAAYGNIKAFLEFLKSNL